MSTWKKHHQAWCRVAIAESNSPKQKRGVALARWFFNIKGRKGQAWTTRDMARITLIPMFQVHQAMLAAKKRGLVELTPKGWTWA
jgi:hypothetical protein